MTQNKGDNWVRKFQVNEPKRHKDGFTVYKVTSIVFPKNAPEAATNITVWKRFNDFKKLHSSLKVHHRNCNIVEELPKLSQSKYFKRFDEEIIQERIKCALELLNFIGRHPALFTCVPFLQFFNTSHQISDTVSNCEINTNDSGIESGSTSALCNNNFLETSHFNGEMRKDDTYQDERNVIDSDNSYLHSSDDESLLIPEGTDALPLDPAPDVKHKTILFDTPGNRRYNDNLDSENKNKTVEDTHEKMAKSLTSLPDHFSQVKETVTCRSEKPIKDSEMWVCVNSQSFQSQPPCLIPSGMNPGEFHPEEYLVEAGYYIGQAQKYEITGEYESAFVFYKAGMACLVSGISEDECKERRTAVEEKIKRYAQRAENVYALHLSKKKEEEEKENILSCSEGLKVYKVLSIIDKVLLVLNTVEDKRYVIKVLQKSPCPIDLKKKTVIPHNVPYMVKLIRFFENENSIFLVLQYASRGKLWDYVEGCFHSYREPQFSDNEQDLTEYKHVEVENNAEVVQEKSYFEIFKDYTTHTAKRVFGYSESEPLDKKADSLIETSSVLAEDSVNPECLNENSEVTDLVKNSRKLLESIKNTLQQSEYVTDNLTKDLNEIETVLENELPEKSRGSNLLDFKNKKRSKSVARSGFERRFSSEDVLEAKSRSASSSLDRSGQWSRLEAMLETAPILSESRIRLWAAEMFVALETLHRWGVTCRDLHPGNILLDDNDHLLLTFQLYWHGVDVSVSEEAVAGLYAAPEATKIFPVTSAADWWSYGALLFQLLTGKSLSSCYPGGIMSHTIITFPEFLSPEACSLLTELLRYEPSERLGGGVNGSDDIKCHPFFNSIDWQLVYGN